MNRRQTGNHDPSISPSGLYACRDGYVAIVAGDDEQFKGLCRAMGREDLLADPRFATKAERVRESHAPSLDQSIGSWVRELTRAEVEAAARKYRFAAAAVATAKDHYDDPHLRARGSVWEMEDPVYGTMVENGPAPKLSETPMRYKWAAKPVGFHNEYVLGRLLGLSQDQIEELERQRVIGKWADRLGPKPPDDWTPGKGEIR
jgi:crotonobetainyl-CoA:carnitine CoA-transferase CaiB-like acyl-CoA transferase